MGNRYYSFLLLIVFVITYYAHKAGVKTGVDYLLANRRLGYFATFAGLYMTMTSAYSFMGMPGLAYRVGVGAWALGLVSAAQAVTMVFYYPKLRALGAKFNFMTQADFLCDRFTNAKSFRVLIAVIGIVATIVGHFAIQLVASGLAFQQITGNQLPYLFGVVFFVVMTTAYIFVGGFRATAWTDIFMGVLMFFTLLFIIGLVLSKLGMNLTPDVYRELAKRQPEMMSLPGKLPFFPYPQITSWVVGYVFAFMLVPHMVMRAYSAASDQVLRVTALGWIPIACFGHFLTATVLGLSAAVLLPVLPKGVAFDAITPYIAFTLSPMPYIVGPVLMMGLFCASVSTAGAALLTMSTIITKDFLIETFNMKLSEGKTEICESYRRSSAWCLGDSSCVCPEEYDCCHNDCVSWPGRCFRGSLHVWSFLETVQYAWGSLWNDCRPCCSYLVDLYPCAWRRRRSTRFFSSKIPAIVLDHSDSTGRQCHCDRSHARTKKGDHRKTL